MHIEKIIIIIIKESRFDQIIKLNNIKFIWGVIWMSSNLYYLYGYSANEIILTLNVSFFSVVSVIV